MRIIIFLFLVFCTLPIPASIFEMIKDDGTFEVGYPCFQTRFFAQHFDMPPVYDLYQAKIYSFIPQPGHTCRITLYDFLDPANPVWLGNVDMSISGVGWWFFNLGSISLPDPKPQTILISVEGWTGYYSLNFGIGIDSMHGGFPEYQHWKNENFAGWIQEGGNIGIRLFYEDYNVRVEPASLGSLKAIYH